MYNSIALAEAKRKAEKRRNTSGDPITFQSKLLAVSIDPFDENASYVAEAAGCVRRIDLEVSS